MKMEISEKFISKVKQKEAKITSIGKDEWGDFYNDDGVIFEVTFEDGDVWKKQRARDVRGCFFEFQEGISPEDRCQTCKGTGMLNYHCGVFNYRHDHPCGMCEGTGRLSD